MITHTPGPWTTCHPRQTEVREFIAVRPLPDKPAVAYVADPVDARLIAAAPDLLAALKGVKGNCWCEHGIGNPMYSDHSAACRAAEAAIAKAEAQ